MKKIREIIVMIVRYRDVITTGLAYLAKLLRIAGRVK